MHCPASNADANWLISVLVNRANIQMLTATKFDIRLSENGRCGHRFVFYHLCHDFYDGQHDPFNSTLNTDAQHGIWVHSRHVPRNLNQMYMSQNVAPQAGVWQSLIRIATSISPLEGLVLGPISVPVSAWVSVKMSIWNGGVQSESSSSVCNLFQVTGWSGCVLPIY